MLLSSELCKIHSATEYFLEDFCRRSFSKLNQVPAASINQSQTTDSSNSDHVSPTELLRLQRAFYRYYTCQNLIRAHAVPHRDFEKRDDELAGFLSAFEPWEAEEIGCVHDYMLSRLDEVVEELEDEFIQSVLDADRRITDDQHLAEEAGKNLEARLGCILTNTKAGSPGGSTFSGLEPVNL